ncbi:MAG: ATP-grasp domain-containing protein [Proteobacteria bacterium]|jgi:5-(carboxyamino)imidazole ribonucleotide synthase|nr:ATP-grasp domain-containing protein [Pseudomonadota bacterium]
MIFHTGQIIGILGGGQLAQMMAQSATRLGFKTIVYCDEISPCAETVVSKVIAAQYENFQKLGEFASECDFITAETENIPVEAISFLEKNFPKKIRISSHFFSIAQNRLMEKKFAFSLEIPIGEYIEVKEKQDAEEFFRKNGVCILKTATQGYDGKGQIKITQHSDIPSIAKNTEYILEAKVAFAFEISVIATKSGNDIQFFPVPLNIHRDGILRESIVPLSVEGFTKQKLAKIKTKALEYAKKIAESIMHNGTFAVEFFALEDGSVLFNEIAPRPHNSGHFSIDLCNVSQFENHIRSVAYLPLLSPVLICNGAMENIIGDDIKHVENYLDKQNYKIHLYGKKYAQGRKLGHVNKLELAK